MPAYVYVHVEAYSHARELFVSVGLRNCNYSHKKFVNSF